MSAADISETIPGCVREALAGRADDLFLDFDETLLLDNSTIAYLRTLRPRALAWLILRVLGALRIWRLLPGEDPRRVYHDWLCVLATSILMPWSLLLWRKVHAPRIAAERANGWLLAELRQRGADPTAIVSSGFGPIVRPLAALILPDTPVICASLAAGFRFRRKGKLRILDEIYGRERVAAASVITDNPEDEELCAVCRRSAVVRWDDAEVEPPFQNLYLPFLYTHNVKRPGKNYVVNGFLKVDGVAILLAFAWPMANPLLGGLGLIALHMAFWAIYEIGYRDNDRIAETREAHPTLTPGYVLHKDRFSVAGAVTYALLFTILGSVLVVLANDGLAGPAALVAGVLPQLGRDGAIFVTVLAWSAWLGVTLLVFRGYNRTAPNGRLVLYPLLQVCRFLGYALIFSATPVGMLLVGAIALGRWYPYMIYRITQTRWNHHVGIFVLVTFVVGAVVAAPVAPHAVFAWQGLAALAWLVFWSRRDIMHFASAASGWN